MKLHIFNDSIAYFEGNDVSTLICDKDGTLEIGEHNIRLMAGQATKVPFLFDGVFDASFVSADGRKYACKNTRVKDGRVVLIPTMTQEEIALRYRCEGLEAKFESLADRVTKVEREYDFNALDFLGLESTTEEETTDTKETIEKKKNEEEN